MFLKSVYSFVLVLLFAVGCNSTENSDSARMVAPTLQDGSAEFDVRIAEKGKGAASGGNMPLPAPGGAFEVSERKIIKTANLTMEIEKYTSWNDAVLKEVQNVGGYIVNSSTSKMDENVMRGNMVIRAPQDKFNTLLKTLKISAKNLENESLGGQDVTEEYYDLEARLANKRKTEARFQEILQAARSVEDILKVEEQLSRIREEIEQMEGRKKFLDNQVGFSTITVEWHEPYPLGVTNGQGFWSKVGEGFKNGINSFGDVLSGVIAFVIGGLPLFVFVSFVLWLVLKIVRRRRARNVAATETDSPKNNDTGAL